MRASSGSGDFVGIGSKAALNYSAQSNGIFYDRNPPSVRGTRAVRCTSNR
jgi:hypothetical protein